MTTPSDLTAEALVASGAEPVVPDPNELLRQIQALQARIDAMAAASGQPADPLAAAVKDVKDHITAQINAHPLNADNLSELKTTAKELSDKPNKDDTELLRTVIDDVRGYVEGLGYVKELANKLHKLVLKG